MKKALHFIMLTPVILVISLIALLVVGGSSWFLYYTFVDFLGVPLWGFVLMVLFAVWLFFGIKYVADRSAKEDDSPIIQRLKEWLF